MPEFPRARRNEPARLFDEPVALADCEAEDEMLAEARQLFELEPRLSHVECRHWSAGRGLNGFLPAHTTWDWIAAEPGLRQEDLAANLRFAAFAWSFQQNWQMAMFDILRRRAFAHKDFNCAGVILLPGGHGFAVDSMSVFEDATFHLTQHGCTGIHRLLTSTASGHEALEAERVFRDAFPVTARLVDAYE